MKRKPKVCILQSDGTNCDEDLFYAFQKSGANPQFVRINEFRNKKRVLSEFQIIALPGGFSYGDDLASGKVLAIELMSFFKKDLQAFIDSGGYVLGVCNGFQTLVRTGLLPFVTLGTMNVTLTTNDSGHFECRWVKMKAEESRASYFNDLEEIIDVSVNHGEGKFITDDKTLATLEKEKLIVFRYVTSEGKVALDYPDNPNGSLHAIAGITDKTGRIFGLMPHPEKFVDTTQHPNWRREHFTKEHGLLIFERIVEFIASQNI